MLARPLLDVPKSQLIATLHKAKLGFADDPTNRDPSFTRPRLRALMPALAAEGGDARNLARLASRLARANAAVEVLADGAERYLALRDRDARVPQPMASFDADLTQAFAACPRKSGFGCCSARSTGSAMRDRPNSARSKPCWRRWTGPWPKAEAAGRATAAEAETDPGRARWSAWPAAGFASSRRRRAAAGRLNGGSHAAAIIGRSLTTPENTGFSAII